MYLSDTTVMVSVIIGFILFSYYYVTNEEKNKDKYKRWEASKKKDELVKHQEYLILASYSKKEGFEIATFGIEWLEKLEPLSLLLLSDKDLFGSSSTAFRALKSIFQKAGADILGSELDPWIGLSDSSDEIGLNDQQVWEKYTNISTQEWEIRSSRLSENIIVRDLAKAVNDKELIIVDDCLLGSLFDIIYFECSDIAKDISVLIALRDIEREKKTKKLYIDRGKQYPDKLEGKWRFPENKSLYVLPDYSGRPSQE